MSDTWTTAAIAGNIVIAEVCFDEGPTTFTQRQACTCDPDYASYEAGVCVYCHGRKR